MWFTLCVKEGLWVSRMIKIVFVRVSFILTKMSFTIIYNVQERKMAWTSIASECGKL